MDYQKREAIKQKATIASVGVAAGAIAWWIVLAHVFGWVGPATAQQQTNAAVQTKVDQVLAPVCAQEFMANKAALAKFMVAGVGYGRDEIVQTTIPKIGSTEVGYRLSDNCATAIQAHLRSASAIAAQNAPSKG